MGALLVIIGLGYLRDMVRTVNRTEVAPDEILSDNVYYYSRFTGRMEIV